jgi:hypothetical protein
MAKLREGLELVRIGKPARPEFAAWRYGDQFGRRRVRNLLIAGAGVTAVGAIAVGGLASAGGIGGAWYTLYLLARLSVVGRREAVVARIPQPRETVPVKRKELSDVRVRATSDGGWLLSVPYTERRALHLAGDEALRAMGAMLPHMNRFGGSREMVADAVRRLEAAERPDLYVERMVRWGARSAKDSPQGFPLTGFDSHTRLALEMALHEESERRAMEGELAALEARWKEAEEVAAIADDLFLPGPVGEALAGLKRRLGGA